MIPVFRASNRLGSRQATFATCLRVIEDYIINKCLQYLSRHQGFWPFIFTLNTSAIGIRVRPTCIFPPQQVQGVCRKN
ncbi:hypothetical protein BMETH_2008_0 [methanotrophic bacterial endosymbiont of Bathymodiolus sp.]|nr:hypothetical protein BMETH_2008_0 [methanotrophic bacterial endosymbiont of Bathymodiolus sp.]